MFIKKYLKSTASCHILLGQPHTVSSHCTLYFAKLVCNLSVVSSLSSLLEARINLGKAFKLEQRKSICEYKFDMDNCTAATQVTRNIDRLMVLYFDAVSEYGNTDAR